MTPPGAQRSHTDRAFERLYRRHVGEVYRYALAMLQHASDAEDVTRATFLNANRAYERGERPEKLQNSLLAIAHNVCRQRFRQASRKPTGVSLEKELAAAARSDDTPTAQDIGRALCQLAFSQRAALVMREIEGRSYAEIADVLQISVRGVETLLLRARSALREQLDGALTCAQAELAISRLVDGRLRRRGRRGLRAHERECAECATLAGRQRAQRAAWAGLATMPVPASLVSFCGSGDATAGRSELPSVAAGSSAGGTVARGRAVPSRKGGSVPRN